MPHSTQDMNCLTHVDTNGNILLAKPEEEVQDTVGFLKKTVFLYQHFIPVQKSYTVTFAT